MFDKLLANVRAVRLQKFIAHARYPDMKITKRNGTPRFRDLVARDLPNRTSRIAIIRALIRQSASASGRCPSRAASREKQRGG